MRPIKVVVASAVFGLVVYTGAALLYVYGGNFTGGFSKSAADWAAFGSYLGGVAGPAFALWTVILLVATVQQHEVSMRQVAGEQLKQDHLRYFETIHADVLYLMRRPLHTADGPVEFGDVFLGVVSAPQDPTTFRGLLSRLLEHAAEYSEALALYRANVNPYFEYKAHRTRVDHLLSFIEKNSGHLEDAERIALSFARDHLKPRNQN